MLSSPETAQLTFQSWHMKAGMQAEREREGEIVKEQDRFIERKEKESKRVGEFVLGDVCP